MATSLSGHGLATDAQGPTGADTRTRDVEVLPRALFAPPPEAAQATELLDGAVEAFLKGDQGTAAALLVAANIPTLSSFARDWMGPKAVHLRRTTRRDPTFPKIKTAARMPPLGVQRSLLERDGYRCRFCGTKVIALGVRSALSRAFPKEVPWPSADDSKMHAAFLALNATLDHLVPHARGGSSAPSNVVTACWPCNFSREDLLLHEIGLADPRQFPPIIDDWDGLSRVLQRPKAISSTRHPKPPRQSPNTTDWSALKPLLDDIAQLASLGVSLRQRHTLLVEIRVGQLTISPLAVTSDGSVEVPWAIGPHKELFRPFAEALAAAIPEGTTYETPKMWRVRKGAVPLVLSDLVEAKSAICAGLVELSARLAATSG